MVLTAIGAIGAVMYFLLFAGRDSREGGRGMKWTIGKKMIAGFLFVSALVAVAGGVGMWGLNRVGSEGDIISDVQIPLADCSMEAEIALISSQDAAGEVMNSQDMKEIEGFILFNVDKETDWSFSIYKKWGVEFKKLLTDPYFKDND